LQELSEVEEEVDTDFLVLKGVLFEWLSERGWIRENDNIFELNASRREEYPKLILSLYDSASTLSLTSEYDH
jgi:hypothetical protein